ELSLPARVRARVQLRARSDPPFAPEPRPFQPDSSSSRLRLQPGAPTSTTGPRVARVSALLLENPNSSRLSRVQSSACRFRPSAEPRAEASAAGGSSRPTIYLFLYVAPSAPESVRIPCPGARKREPAPSR